MNFFGDISDFQTDVKGAAEIHTSLWIESLKPT